MKTPEHDKQEKVIKTSQEIGRFLDWLQDEKGVSLAHYQESTRLGLSGPVTEEVYIRFAHSRLGLLAEFYGIDLDRLEDEKIAILAELNNPGPAPIEPIEWDDGEPDGEDAQYDEIPMGGL